MKLQGLNETFSVIDDCFESKDETNVYIITYTNNNTIISYVNPLNSVFHPLSVLTYYYYSVIDIARDQSIQDFFFSNRSEKITIDFCGQKLLEKKNFFPKLNIRIKISEQQNDHNNDVLSD